MNNGYHTGKVWKVRSSHHREIKKPSKEVGKERRAHDHHVWESWERGITEAKGEMSSPRKECLLCQMLEWSQEESVRFCMVEGILTCQSSFSGVMSTEMIK